MKIGSRMERGGCVKCKMHGDDVGGVGGEKEGKRNEDECYARKDVRGVYLQLTLSYRITPLVQYSRSRAT